MKQVLSRVIILGLLASTQGCGGEAQDQEPQEPMNQDAGPLADVSTGGPTPCLDDTHCDVATEWIGRIIGVLRLQAKYRRA